MAAKNRASNNRGAGTSQDNQTAVAYPEASAQGDPKRKPGRPRAKHSDKVNYAQMSLYIRREIRNRTKVRLFEQGLEFSALVENLLEVWLEDQEQK